MDGLSLSNKKEQTIDTSNNLDGSQKHDALWRREDAKEYILYNSIEIGRA